MHDGWDWICRDLSLQLIPNLSCHPLIYIKWGDALPSFFCISRSALDIRGFLQILQLPKDATDILIFFHQLFFRWLPGKRSTSVWIHLDGPQRTAHQNALKVHPTRYLIWPVHRFIALQQTSENCNWDSFWVSWPISFFHYHSTDVKCKCKNQSHWMNKMRKKNHRVFW